MILELRQYTPEEYTKVTDKYYKKPGAPEIEYQLQDLQWKILIEGDYSVLPEMKLKLSEYAKSLLLKQIKGGTDYIEPLVVENLASIAAENFVKRYFRGSDPIVGVSFAGVLEYKVREVKAAYFGQKSIDSMVSLDDVYGSGDDEHAVSKETKLSYKEYLKLLSDQNVDLDLQFEQILERIDSECELLTQIKDFKKLDLTFLKYLLYITLLQQERKDKKINIIAKQALAFVVPDAYQATRLAPILESALLDVQGV